MADDAYERLRVTQQQERERQREGSYVAQDLFRVPSECIGQERFSANVEGVMRAVAIITFAVVVALLLGHAIYFICKN
jgi:hypothetical protein